MRNQIKTIVLMGSLTALLLGFGRSEEVHEGLVVRPHRPRYRKVGICQVHALRLCGLPEAAPALLCGTPTLPVGQPEFAAV